MKLITVFILLFFKVWSQWSNFHEVVWA